jgi:2-dehydro-3-deoxy-D-arabinonate dehydratase
MKIFRTQKGILVDQKGSFYLLEKEWDEFVNDDHLFQKILMNIENHRPINNSHDLLTNDLLAPILSQELWAAGVTYYKSKSARMDESRETGGDSFYDRVYNADRPELFFKANGFRVKGHGEGIRIRKDSFWNVPEPELTLFIASSGKILGYTIGNDVSSRSIEGENPLYLPQAKTFNGSAAIGPGIWLTEDRLDENLKISMLIKRDNRELFQGSTSLKQMKRTLEDLVSYLLMELDFPNGCFLMTGTGIVPSDDFTLAAGDQVEITIDHIGTLRNRVE